MADPNSKPNNNDPNNSGGNNPNAGNPSGGQPPQPNNGGVNPSGGAPPNPPPPTTANPPAQVDPEKLVEQFKKLDAEKAQFTQESAAKEAELKAMEENIAKYLTEVHTSTVGQLTGDQQQMIKDLAGDDKAKQVETYRTLNARGVFNPATPPPPPVNNHRAGTETPPKPEDRSLKAARQKFRGFNQQT